MFTCHDRKACDPKIREMSAFQNNLSSLSHIQKQAVDKDTGALLVLAGPGSGKTRVITTRIARLLHEKNDEPFRVLALTFTNRAADEMGRRIDLLVPEAENRLFVGTFHSFCVEILRLHGANIGVKTDFRIISTSEDRDEVSRRAIASNPELNDKHLKLLKLVDRAKSKLLPSDGISTKFPNPDRGRLFELFYRAYDRALLEANALDFNSLIFAAYNLFSRFPPIARHYRSVYRYWCVDEFQDTNLAQYQLLKVIAGEEFRNVFVVADDDQIIYQWNGANHNRLDQFRYDFAADVLQIPTNFRCPPEVVACANNLIASNRFRSHQKKPLIAHRDPTNTSSVIEVLAFETDREEAEGIARHILDHRQGQFQGTVVLARVRKLLNPICEALTTLDIRSQIVLRRDDFLTQEFKWLQNALRLKVRNTDERVFQAFCANFNSMFGCKFSQIDRMLETEIKRTDLFIRWYRAVQASIENQDALSLANTAAKYYAGDLDQDSFIRTVCAMFDKWPEQATEVREKTTNISDLKDDRTAWHGLMAEIIRSIGYMPDPERFLQELDLRSKTAPVSPNTVSLMTIHGAKGTEFDHVYLCGLVEDQLPFYRSKRSGDHSAEFEEERRNCFVAITRSQQSLTLSLARKYSGWVKEPSRFLREMKLPYSISN